MALTIDEVIEKLKVGNDNFVTDKLDGKLQDSTRRSELTGGQNPHTIVLSCADSRVVPELAFDTGLGELFVCRVAGNVPNVSTVASIEYAIAHLGTQVIVVMGHESCGAVGAAIAGGDNGPNINKLVSYIQPAIDACGHGAETNDVVRKNAELVSEALVSNSSIIKDAKDAGKLRILAAYYNLDSGKVDFL
jgi:carbonic anhydrase